MLYEDIDLLLKRSKNVPKKSSFLKRDLDARKDSEAYRWDPKHVVLMHSPNSETLFFIHP